MHEKTVNAVQQLLFKFACSSCDFKTGTKFNLKRHNVSHFQVKKTHRDKPDVPNTTVSCTVCQKTFANSWNLKRHQQDVHGLTEKDNTVQNSAGMAGFTTEALVKETVIEKYLQKL